MTEVDEGALTLRFEKWQGIGNDFLIVHADAVGARLGPEAARVLCDRHLGVGADGVLVVDVRDGRPSMRVLNADGSTPQMCGNGLRCVARYLASRAGFGPEAFEVDTDAGPHRVRVLADGQVEVDMRPASLAPASLPLRSEQPWIDEPIEVLGQSLRVTAVSMGNPHAVLFDTDTMDANDRDAIGPALEHDPRFPERVNVGFAQLEGAGLTLYVWERGVGWTQACGTGACAAAVAAVETRRARRGVPIVVRLPGGPLTIEVGAPAAPIRMTGAARHVFDGTAAVASALLGPPR